MPASLIQDQNHLPLGADLLADKVQMGIHIVRVDGRCDEGRRIAGDRIDGPEEINPLVFGLLDRCGASSLFGPDRRQGSLLADPRFVLEPDFDAPVGALVSDPLDKKGASQSHCSMACGSFLRCLGRGLRQESPRRWSRS
jgi:hypothetical protein